MHLEYNNSTSLWATHLSGTELPSVSPSEHPSSHTEERGVRRARSRKRTKFGSAKSRKTLVSHSEEAYETVTYVTVWLCVYKLSTNRTFQVFALAFSTFPKGN